MKNSFAKFSFSKNNLNVILGKQICVSNKAGIGYKPKKQQKLLDLVASIILRGIGLECRRSNNK